MTSYGDSEMNLVHVTMMIALLLLPCLTIFFSFAHLFVTVTASALYEKKKYNMTTSPDYKYGSVNDIEKQESSLITSSTRDSHSHRHHTHVSELEGANEKLVAMATTGQRVMLRNLAIQGSLVINVTILLVKAVAYYRTLSLSVLAALVDSLLDVVSQVVLYFAERHAKENHSSALYPAGASRMEPIGVLTCAALMGIASFEVLQESINSIFFGHEDMNLSSIHISSVLSMMTIVLVKVGLLKLCEYAAADGGSAIIGDSTLEALAQDHLNDALSNFVAAIALISTYLAPSLWFFDPVGAIFISLYIIHSWYSTGKEMIEQLIGKAAPEDFIDEIIEIASKHDTRMTVDVCRAYHFGPKFLVSFDRYSRHFFVFMLSFV